MDFHPSHSLSNYSMLKFLSFHAMKNQLSTELSSLECLIFPRPMQLFCSFFIFFPSLKSVSWYFGLLIFLPMPLCFSSFSLQPSKAAFFLPIKLPIHHLWFVDHPLRNTKIPSAFILPLNENSNGCWHFPWYRRVWSGQMRKCLLNVECYAAIAT